MTHDPYGGSPYLQAVYGEVPPRGPDETPPSRGLAGWSLVLSSVGCLGLPLLVSAGLAVTALVRSGDGRDHGKGMAIAALVVDASWVVLVVVLVVLASVAPSHPRGADGQVEYSTTLRFGDLRTGDCFDSSTLLRQPGSDPTFTLVDVVPCRAAHEFEVFHQDDLSNLTRYPGDALSRQGRTECAATFEAFVGTSAAASRLTLTPVVPSAEDWRSRSTRVVRCLVRDPAGPTRGTLQGSRR